MKLDIIRAWKDDNYRLNLSEEQIHALPANPVGELELADDDLDSATRGGAGWTGIGSWGSGEIVNGQMHSFALTCKEAVFSVNVITGTRVLDPITIICIHSDDDR